MNETLAVECPLCNGQAGWVAKDAPSEQKGFHHWCDICKHGWYISDLRNIAAHNLLYTCHDKRAKSPDEIRGIIRVQDEKIQLGRNKTGVGE